MIVYTYTEARQRLARLLEQVLEEGEVRIRRRDGKVFVIKQEEGGGSPLDVAPVPTELNRDEIVAEIRESRRSYPRGDRTGERD